MTSELAWPLRMRLDGEVWTFNDQWELETSAEFVSDWTADYVCHDAEGRRLRLVIDRLALLFVADVHGEWSIADLTISALHHGAETLFLELSADVLHRTLRHDGRHRWTPSPLWPNPLEPLIIGDAEATDMSAGDFDSQWIKATRKLLRY